MRMLPIVGVAVAAVLILAMMTFFRVDERQQALVLQFGQVKQEITRPGLNWKVPLVQDVVYYEDRILPLETSALEVTPADERRLIVDAFARWRIEDVVRFRQSVQTERNAMLRLERILNAALRQVLGSVQSSDVLSPERTVLMQRIRDAARREAEALGVNIIDVRIRRADLPEQNLQATFERMEAERQREAADERARGKERAQEVRATADRAAVELVSDAQRQAEIIRGEADATRSQIYADAFGRDEEFFAFHRSLTAYERALRGENSTLVMAPEGEFFDYLRSDRGQFVAAPAAPGVAPDVTSDAGEQTPARAAETVEPESETVTATEPAPVIAGSEDEPTSKQVERILESADRLDQSVQELERGTAAGEEGLLESSEAAEEAGETGQAASPDEEEQSGPSDAAETSDGAETTMETEDGVVITRTVEDGGDDENEPAAN